MSEQLAAEIRAAFADVPAPADWALRGSNEGSEPRQVEDAFRGKKDWTALEGEFLDSAPDGLGSALSFLSDEAFRYYLPAYLLADLRGELDAVDPVFHLTFGLDEDHRDEPVNALRFGARTWFDSTSHRFSTFEAGEVSAIVSFLRHKGGQEAGEALANYWEPRLEALRA